MFKKLIILVLIALLAIPAITGCSSNKEQPAPPATAAEGQQPTAPNIPNATDATPTPQTALETTPATTPGGKEYKKGDVIVISGEITLVRDLKGNDFSEPPGKSLTAEAFLLKPDPDINPSWYELRVYLKKPAVIKLNSKVTIEGIVGEKINSGIIIRDTVIR